jgi:hypothetical protein
MSPGLENVSELSGFQIGGLSFGFRSYLPIQYTVEVNLPQKVEPGVKKIQGNRWRLQMTDDRLGQGADRGKMAHRGGGKLLSRE